MIFKIMSLSPEDVKAIADEFIKGFSGKIVEFGFNEPAEQIAKLCLNRFDDRSIELRENIATSIADTIKDQVEQFKNIPTDVELKKFVRDEVCQFYFLSNDKR